MVRTRPRASSAVLFRERGLILLVLLLAMMLAAIAAMAGAQSWATALKREREEQLMFVGDQYRMAIGHYYYASPRGGSPMLPAQLGDLLADPRFLQSVRHLRRMYPDPITGGSEWGLVKRGNGIAGIYSLSEASPLKQSSFDSAYAGFEQRKSYREWIFIFTPVPIRNTQ